MFVETKQDSASKLGLKRMLTLLIFMIICNEEKHKDGDDDESVKGHMLYDGWVNSHSSDTLSQGETHNDDDDENFHTNYSYSR